MKVVIAGGGTAGHLNPGLAVAESLRARGAEVFFIGAARGIEARAVPERGFPFTSINISGRDRGFSRHNFTALIKLPVAVAKCISALARISPDVVLTTGGYVSLPPSLAAFIHRIPLIVHEQNAVFGLANRIASRFAAAVAVSFPGTEQKFGERGRLTGNPVRPEIASLDRAGLRAEALAHFDLAPGRSTLLIFGGSQGARRINEISLDSYELLKNEERLQVLHLTGPKNHEQVSSSLQKKKEPSDQIVWRAVASTDRMDLAYAAADLALCRAGATTIAELTAVGLPAVFIPLPFALDNDQLHNAQFITKAGGAHVLLEPNLNPPAIQKIVDDLCLHPETLHRMSDAMRTLARPDAADRVTDLIEEIARAEGRTGGVPTAGDSARSTRPTSLHLAGSTARLEPAVGSPGEAAPQHGRAAPALPGWDPAWRKVHMVGIGGVGMGPIARVLLAAGLEVTGSDLRESAATARLRELGIEVSIGHRPAHVEGRDVVVASAAVPQTNIELEAAGDKAIPVLYRGEALGKIFEGRRLIAITGAHGKTTTSGMVATILEVAGMDPTYVLGADILTIGSGGAIGPGGHLGAGEFAVVEADEAFATFLWLRPEVSMVLNIDADHLDYYGSMESLGEAFGRFMALASKSVIVCKDDQRATSAAEAAGVLFTTYGFDPAAGLRVQDLITSVKTSSFTLIAGDETLGRVELQVGGRHNAQNAAAAAAACLAIGMSFEQVRAGLESFRGVSRRFEYRGMLHGAELVDDYAHHPTEIEATLAAARWGPWSRIVAVFQPALYTRTQSLWREFGRALSEADVVVVTDIYGSREQPIPGITGKLVAEAACEQAPYKKVAYLPHLDEAAAYIRTQARPGDLILSLGSGDVTTFADRVLRGGSA
jgi:UDP-N-acetylmuramate--alanine ligase